MSEHVKRKAEPIARGVLDYFPDAIRAVANVSFVCSEQHNPGEPMRWAKEKSSDHADCVARHLIDRGKLDHDGLRHTAKVAWRALALLQIEIESERPKVSTDVQNCTTVIGQPVSDYERGYKDAMNHVRVGCGLPPNP